MSQKKKRRSISLKDKLSILKDIENGKKIKDICNEYKVAKSTISKVKENKDNLEEYASKTYMNQSKVKRMKRVKYSEIDDAVFAWFLERRQLNDFVTNEMMKLKAREVNRLNNGPETFVASDGWLTKFKKRHGIQILSVCRESMPCNVDPANSFRNYIAENGFLPEQIYNCETSDLVYKSLPHKSNIINLEKSTAGRKAMKERVTIMPCVNATGTHKLDLMIIGKSNTPSFLNNTDLPVYYKSSKNAWQMYTHFSDWYSDIFIPSVTRHMESKDLPVKALLLVDNASWHGSENNFTDNPNFKVMFSPFNDTPLLQPLDHNVTKSLKQRYRKHLLLCLAASSAKDGMVSALKNITLKDAVYLVAQAWNEIPMSVIQNSFEHYFSSSDEIQYISCDHFSADDVPLERLYNSVFDDCNLSDTEIMEWANGTGEGDHSFNLEENPEVESEITSVKENEKMQDDSSKNVTDVINSFNLVIEWAKENDLPFKEVLLLLRIRERAIMKKYM